MSTRSFLYVARFPSAQPPQDPRTRKAVRTSCAVAPPSGTEPAPIVPNAKTGQAKAGEAQAESFSEQNFVLDKDQRQGNSLPFFTQDDPLGTTLPSSVQQSVARELRELGGGV